MSIWQRIAREPNAILGLIVAVYGVLVAFEVLAFTAQQVGAVTAFGGALVILLRWVVTPAGEVVVQRKPDGRLDHDGSLVVASEKTGTLIIPGKVDARTIVPRHDERGTINRDYIVVAFLAALAVLFVVWLV